MPVSCTRKQSCTCIRGQYTERLVEDCSLLDCSLIDFLLEAHFWVLDESGGINVRKAKERYLLTSKIRFPFEYDQVLG